MKKITFLAAFIVALVSFNSAKAQVRAHIGINIGQPAYYDRPVYYDRPAYYAPQRVVVVERRPVYGYPGRNYYRRGPVMSRRGYYSQRPVIMHHRGHGYGHGGFRRW
jgi:hypothetical protein